MSRRMQLSFEIRLARATPLAQLAAMASSESPPSSDVGQLASPPTRDRRPYQDYTAWNSYGTLPFWTLLRENPSLVLDLVAQRLHTVGLINPAETTSKEIVAAILVAMHGRNGVMFLPDTEIDGVYNMFKASCHLSHCVDLTLR